jgi:hypothetical protein
VAGGLIKEEEEEEIFDPFFLTPINPIWVLGR